MTELTIESVGKVVEDKIAPLREEVANVSQTLHGRKDNRDDLGLVGDVTLFKRLFKWIAGMMAIVAASAILGTAAAVFNTIVAVKNLEQSALNGSNVAALARTALERTAEKK